MDSLLSTTTNLTTCAPPDASAAYGVLTRHAHNPSAFLALNEGTQHFGVEGVDGLVAYRPAGRRHLVQIGGVFADPDDQHVLIDQFVAEARRDRRAVVAVQLMREDAERYAAHGFTVNQFGASYARNIEEFSLKGSAHVRLRNKLSRARRAGVIVTEAGLSSPQATELEAALAAIDTAWLRSKGRHVKELRFMVGERGGRGGPWRRTFAATGPDGSLLGYITFSPVPGRHAGWLHDLSRRDPDAPPGTMELIITTAVEHFRAEGARFLHFGLTPFTGLDPAHEVASASKLAAATVRFLATHGEKIYPAKDQVAYKEKWAPDLLQPEYVAFSRRVTAGAVWSLLRLTNAA